MTYTCILNDQVYLFPIEAEDLVSPERQELIDLYGVEPPSYVLESKTCPKVDQYLYEGYGEWICQIYDNDSDAVEACRKMSHLDDPEFFSVGDSDTGFHPDATDMWDWDTEFPYTSIMKLAATQ